MMVRLSDTRRLPIWLLALLAVFLADSISAADSATQFDNGKEFSAALQKRYETADIASRVARLAASGTYEEAEKILAGLLREKPLSLDGNRMLEKVYVRLSTMEQLRVWNQWCSARPTSHFPFTVRGMYFLERARFLNGANNTLLLSERQRRDFDHFLRSGRADLEKAAELNSSAPGPPAALTSLSIHLELPRTDMEKWFQRSLANDPGWLGAYRAKLLYLSPWWYGSDQMMAQFARQCFASGSTASNTYAVALDYLRLKTNRLGKGLQAQRFLLDPVIYRMMSSGLDRYVVDYPFSPYIGAYISLRERAIADAYVAIAAFTETLDRDAKNVESRKGRIRAYLGNRQFREAEADLNYLERLQGATSFSRFYLGTMAFQSGQNISRAHQLIDEALLLESSGYRRKNYFYRRAEFYRQSGRHPEAVSDYSAALNEDILFEEGYLGRAQSRYAQSDLEGALADLVVIKSTIKGRLTTKARSLINSYLKKPAKIAERSPISGSLNYPPQSSRTPAKSEKKAAAGPNNDHREFLVRGLRYFYENQLEAARRDFYRVISHEPTNAKAYFMLGKIAAQHDVNQVNACLFFKEAYRLSPHTPDYLNELSRCL